MEGQILKLPTSRHDPESRKLVSIIMPARNEEGNLVRAYAEVTAAMAGLPYEYEVLVVDNDSTDRTGELATGLCGRDRRWRYLRFSRNFQVEGSIAAGLRAARGDAAIVLFSDLQDPPELLPQFLQRWEDGYDVVFGVLRRRAGDPWWRATAARLFYRLVHVLGDVHVPANATDFRLLSRRAIDALNRCDERNRYVRGLAHWIGFRQCPVPYDRRLRQAGRSKATLSFCLGFALNALTGFSIKPLRAFLGVGLLAAAMTACVAAVTTVGWLTGGFETGVTGVHLLLLANLSALLLGFGTVGEYVGRIYIETRQRPLYLVEEVVNLDEPAEASGVPAGPEPDWPPRRPSGWKG